MIFADKLIDLRKKNGWSQEELAEKLNVSRQSVSKWESAQSVPDLARILQLAELFGVSTDYFLKDALEEPQPGEGPVEESGARTVTMEEANAFLETRERNAGSVALGVMLCILSPVMVLLLVGTQYYTRLGLSEDQAVGIAVPILFLHIAGAVALFVISGLRGRRFQELRNEPIETLYGVDGMVRERRERFQSTFAVQLTLGIVLCVLSVLPIFVCLFFFGDEAEAPMVVASAVLLAMIAVGVLLIVRSAMIRGSFQILLEQGGYSREEKARSKRVEPYAGAYWLIVTAAFLALSFLTNAWDRTWIIWPVAAVLFAAIFGVARALGRRDG